MSWPSCTAHAEDTLPFGIAEATKLRPVIHSGSFIGTEVPIWDIADRFGDTNLLVTNLEQARDLATCLGPNSVALMRGHGFASAARSLIEVVRLSVYLPAQRPGAGCAQTARAARSPVAGRDCCAQRGYALFGRLAQWEFLGQQGRLRHLLPAPTSRRRRAP